MKSNWGYLSLGASLSHNHNRQRPWCILHHDGLSWVSTSGQHLLLLPTQILAPPCTSHISWGHWPDKTTHTLTSYHWHINCFMDTLVTKIGHMTMDNTIRQQEFWYIQCLLLTRFLSTVLLYTKRQYDVQYKCRHIAEVDATSPWQHHPKYPHQGRNANPETMLSSLMTSHSGIAGRLIWTLSLLNRNRLFYGPLCIRNGRARRTLTSQNGLMWLPMHTVKGRVILVVWVGATISMQAGAPGMQRSSKTQAQWLGTFGLGTKHTPSVPLCSRSVEYQVSCTLRYSPQALWTNAQGKWLPCFIVKVQLCQGL